MSKLQEVFRVMAHFAPPDVEKDLTDALRSAIADKVTTLVLSHENYAGELRGQIKALSELFEVMAPDENVVLEAINMLLSPED